MPFAQSPILFRSRRPVTLLGAGVVDPAQLDHAISLAPDLIAADGGADTARRLGHKTQAIIGDLDSLTNAEYWQKSGTKLHAITEQISTDFEKCLYSIEAPLFLGLGVLGDRLDHQMAALSALLAYRKKPVILLSPKDLVFHCPETLLLELPPEARVSLFPLAPVRGTVSEGLRWSVAGLDLQAGGRIGTSNRAVGGQVRVAFDRPGTLVMLEPAHLEKVIAALLA